MNKQRETLMPKKERIDRERDCRICMAKCCRHVATGIDKPTCKRDYDNIRWYLMHENVNVFIDTDGDWFIEFVTPCTKLLPDNQCADYENRPDICRKYPPEDSACEYENDDPPYKVLFTNAEEFGDYLARRKRVRRRNKGAA